MSSCFYGNRRRSRLARALQRQSLSYMTQLARQMRCTLRKFVFPPPPDGIPALTTIGSPVFANPASDERARDEGEHLVRPRILWNAERCHAPGEGKLTPHALVRRQGDDGEARPFAGHLPRRIPRPGRRRDEASADLVGNPHRGVADGVGDRLRVREISNDESPTRHGICVSAMAAISRIIATVSRGYLPTAVSADSITASVPSRMAFATSLASARVGRGLSTIDCSICVAVMTGTPSRFARRMMSF